MKTDHTDFITKHHKPNPGEMEMHRPQAFSMWLVVLLLLLSFVLCLSLAMLMDIDKEAMVAAGCAFVLSAGIAFVVQRVFYVRNRKDRLLELLSEVIEGSRGARLITDGRDRSIYANQKFQTMCKNIGAPSIETLSKLFEHDEETLNHFRMLADQAYRGLTDSIELKGRHDEDDVWYQVTAQPVAGWAGYIHWRVDDISSRREGDRAIREEREKLIDFTDNAPVGFFSADQNGRFVFVNATLARWLGDGIQNILKEGRLHTYIQDVPKDTAPYDVIAGGGAKQIAEVVMKGTGGKTFAASISQAVVDEGGGVVRTRGVVHDLTAERAMRQALQASEDRFQRFFEEAPLGIAMVGPEGTIDDCNPLLANMLGFDMEKIEGKPFESIIDESDRHTVLAALDRIEKGQDMRAPMEISLLGQEHNVAVQMYARRFEGSDNIVLHFTDMTEQKKLEEQFVQSQKMQAIGQLAGGIAHDFNNLLTAMIGFCDLLLLRHKAGDPSFSDIMQIKQNSNRAANLVRQLLAFSRQQTLRPKVQDFSDILTELSHLMRRLLGANVELEVIHGSDLGLVKVDVGQMEQVLINLAVNARDAMDGGGKLTITTANFDNDKVKECRGDDMPAGHWVSIAVTDTGSGITAENLNRIFEPFFTTKDVGQGTGLGLATVYGIIRQTGGYLDVKSIVGKGTTFTLYLQRLSESEEEDYVADVEVIIDETQDLTGTARIMLVEDEAAVRTFSSRALVNKGYEVLEGENGEDALSVLEAQTNKHLDLLITDVIMPNMDGPTLAQRMRQISPELKIIFISGYTEEKLKEHLGENIWFLPKPFTLQQLAAKVKEALEE